MTDLKELIEQEIDQYLEWPTADKSHVTTASAKLFAEHVARLYAGQIAEARKKASRPQIREVFLRNGARIEPDHDDLPDYVYESVFELLDSVIQQAGPAIQYVAPAVQGEPVAHISHTSEGDILGWERQFDAPNHTTLYAAQQPAEQQPELAKYQPCGCVICTCEHETQCQGCGAKHCGTHLVGQIPGPVYQQPAPDSVEIDPKDLIVQPWSSRVRSQWDYSLERGVKITHVPSGITVTCDAERSMYANKNKALCDLQTQLAVNPAPDVAGLVEALVAILEHDSPINIVDTATATERDIFDIARAALAAHRKGGE